MSNEIFSMMFLVTFILVILIYIYTNNGRDIKVYKTVSFKIGDPAGSYSIKLKQPANTYVSGLRVYSTSNYYSASVAQTNLSLGSSEGLSDIVAVAAMTQTSSPWSLPKNSVYIPTILSGINAPISTDKSRELYLTIAAGGPIDTNGTFKIVLICTKY